MAENDKATTDANGTGGTPGSPPAPKPPKVKEGDTVGLVTSWHGKIAATVIGVNKDGTLDLEAVMPALRRDLKDEAVVITHAPHDPAGLVKDSWHRV